MKNMEWEKLLREAASRRPASEGLRTVEALRGEFARRKQTMMVLPPWWSYAIRLAALFLVAALMAVTVFGRGGEAVGADMPEIRLPEWECMEYQLIGAIPDSFPR